MNLGGPTALRMAYGGFLQKLYLQPSWNPSGNNTEVLKCNAVLILTKAGAVTGEGGVTDIC